MLKKITGLLALALIAIGAAASIANAQFTATLSWVDNSTNEDGFTIERQLNAGAFTVVAAAVGANLVTYTDSTLQQALVVNTYCYRVAAFNSAGVSGYSNTACKTIPAIVVIPNAPSGLTVAAISSQVLEMSWANDTPQANVEMARRPANDPQFVTIATVAPGKSAYRQTGLPSRATFCYKARAVQGGQQSGYSEMACATTR